MIYSSEHKEGHAYILVQTGDDDYIFRKITTSTLEPYIIIAVWQTEGNAILLECVENKNGVELLGGGTVNITSEDK